MALSSQDQAGHVSGYMMQEAGLAMVTLTYGFHQSKQKQLASYFDFEGQAEATWEIAREKKGIREEILPAAHPHAGRCSCTENYPEATIAVTMTMSEARH